MAEYVVTPQNIEALKAKITAEDHYSDDDSLKRLLLAAGGDIDKAATFHHENVVWRKQFAVDKLTIASVFDELETGKLISPGNVDKDGRPTIYLRPRFINKSTVDILEAMKSMVYMFEMRLKQVKNTIGEVSLIVDFTDASLQHVDFRLPRTLLQLVNEHYQRRVGRINVLNPPWFFKYVWSVISKWMDPHFRSLVTVGSASDLLEGYTVENILEEHGGKKKFDFREWNRERVTEEKFDVNALIKKKGEEKHVESEPDNLLVEAMQDEEINESLDKAEIVGYLTKLGGIVKNWKRRYCIVKHGILRYYESETSLKAQGAVILERARVEDAPADYEKKNCLVITTPLRTWYFFADSEEEKNKWKAALNKQIEFATAGRK